MNTEEHGFFKIIEKKDTEKALKKGKCGSIQNIGKDY
jgi:hypothetical protein